MQQKSTKIVSILYIVVLCMIACKHKKNNSDIKITSPYFSTMMKLNENGVFRGLNFNMDVDAVQKVESSKLFETTSDHLFYELSFPVDSSQFVEYANLQYFFNGNNQLDIITADVFLNDSIQEKELYQSLKKYFDDNFDAINNDNGNFLIWRARFKDSKLDENFDYTIGLKNFTEDYGVTIEYLLQ